MKCLKVGMLKEGKTESDRELFSVPTAPGTPGLAGSPRLTMCLSSLAFRRYLFTGFVKESEWAVTKRTAQKGEWF